MYDIVIVGAGLHSLTFLCALLESHPMDRHLVDASKGIVRSRLNERAMRKRMMERAKLSKEQLWKGLRITVVDKHGRWLQNWKNQFRTLNIETLRSNAALHPDPVDPEMLFEFARMQGYSIEEGFEEIKGVERGKQFVGPFQTPRTVLFNAFCEYLINSYKLKDVVIEGNVQSISPVDTNQRPCFSLKLGGGDVIIGRKVVVSIGHSNLPRYPDWVDVDTCPSTSIIHAWDLVHRPPPEDVTLRKESIVIIGGGLTAVQLVQMAVNHGCPDVTLVSRKRLNVRPFDSDLRWSGKKRYTKLRQFWTENEMKRRWQSIQEARQGGTITPMANDVLRELEANGKCTMLEDVEVWDAQWDGDAFHIELSNANCMRVNKIWLATGSEIDIHKEPLFAEIMKLFKVPPTFTGYPVLDAQLKLHPQLDIYIIGAYASLALGPDGVNLAGARRAAFILREVFSLDPGSLV